MPVNVEHLRLQIEQQRLERAPLGEIHLEGPDGVKIAGQRVNIRVQREATSVHHPESHDADRAFGIIAHAHVAWRCNGGARRVYAYGVQQGCMTQRNAGARVSGSEVDARGRMGCASYRK